MSTLRRKRAGGFLLIELAISLFVVGMLAGLTMYTLQRFARTREHYALRQTVAWAAEAQLARLRAGAPLDSLPPAGALPEGVHLEMTATPGEGEWAQMTLVRVRATIAPRHGRTVVEEIAGYVIAGGQP